jgi:hypothetical protein
MNYDLSICLPAHRTYLWQTLYESVQKAVGNVYSWELVMVGPNEPPPFFSNKSNFKFYKDYGSPARCFQISITLAEGDLITWASDDGYYLDDSLSSCIKQCEGLEQKDILIVRHVEGINHAGKEPPKDFWRAWHHPTLRLAGVPEDFFIVLNGMMRLNYLRDLGGVDCIYENYNMNLHDLAFRAQRAGSKIYFSDVTALNCDWNPNTGDHIPVAEAHNKHDYPLFAKLMSQDQSGRMNIDLFNWTKSPKVWIRRFGNTI